MDRPLDIVLYGATGYTGRLVAEHLLQAHGGGHDLKWGLAGRSRGKLEAVRADIDAPMTLPLIVADSTDAASLTHMARQARAIITTAGPYQLYGSALVAACAAQGTDYVDITGEPHWIHEMLTHEATAKATGARIVFSCGFDSIPFELGVFFLQEAAKAKYGSALQRVRGRIRGLNSGVRGRQSGGSVATGVTMLGAMQRDPRIGALLMDPFALTPGFKGPEQPDATKPYADEVAGSWVAPFIMAFINSKTVHRANLLLGHPWGKDFRYDEMTMTDGPQTSPPVNPFADMSKLPKPGEGASKADREGGCYDVLFIGETADGRTLRASVVGDVDAGGGSTSRIVAECAICLVRDIPRERKPGGIWTGASAMGNALIERLTAHAGLTFRIEGT
jgi:short subunit dehydrogenase-like uncharacterized protein